jgi:hypothetical protein
MIIDSYHSMLSVSLEMDSFREPLLHLSDCTV